MPWNCLCAAKEKRKLEISAPILNIEDTHNNQLQLVPLKQQQQQQQQQPLQTVAYKFDEKNKKLARRHSTETKKSSSSGASATTTANIGSSNSDSRLNGGFTKEQQQQQQQQQLTCNNNDGSVRKISSSKWKRSSKKQQNNNKLINQKTTKTSSKKKNANDNNLQGSPETLLTKGSAEDENGKITKQLTNVKFSFDTKSKKEKVKDTTKVTTAKTAADATTTENDNKNLKCNGTSPGCTVRSSNAISTTEEKEVKQGSYEKNAATAVKNNNKINENVNIADVEQLKNENTGNYDEIPLIRVVERNAEGSTEITCLAVSTTIDQVGCQQMETNVSNEIFLPSTPTPSAQLPLSSSVPAFPLDKSSESIPFIDDDENAKLLLKDPKIFQQPNAETNSMTHKEQHHQHQQSSEDDHNARFITLHPKNVVSLHTYTKQLQDEQASKYLELATKQQGKSGMMIGNEESFSPPPPQLSESVEHNFQVWKAAKGKLCQVCHGSLIVKPNSVVKCFNCDLICHNWCASTMPTIRYYDTSYVIFRKWSKAQDELAFPSVHQYATTKRTKVNPASVLSHQTDDHYLTDSECTYSNGKPFSNQNGKQQRRRTKSLEKCIRSSDNDEISLIIEEPVQDNQIQPVKNAKDDQNNNALNHEMIKLQIVESTNENSINTDTNLKIADAGKEKERKQQSEQKQSPSSCEAKEKFSHDVIVDVHRSDKSQSDSIDSSNELLVIREHEYESLNTKDKISNVPDEVRMRDKSMASNIEKAEQQSLRASDSSDRTLTSEMTSNIAPVVEHKIKPQSEPSYRKNYNRAVCYSPISTTSSSSLSLHTDDPDEGIVEYATVDLRKPGGNIYTVSEDQLFSKTSDDRKPDPIPKSQSFPVQTKHHYHQHHQHHQHHSNQIIDTLRLHYVTQRILASVLPRRDPNDPSSAIIINRPHSEGHVSTPHGIEDKYEKEVISMLEQKHGKNYKVLDLESCISVVTLERLCELCKLIDQWLGSGQEKVIVLQDREDRQRLGAAIAAYLEYLDICASNFPIRRNGISNEDLRAQNTIARNWLDLDIFSMKKFLEDFIGPLRIPSYKRYLQLFSGLLSGKIRMNSSPIRLEFISVESPPSWLQYDRFSTSTSSSSQTEWNSFIKIYEGLQCIYTSDIHIIPITTRQFLYQIGNLRLRGDILIRCYQIISNENNFNKGATRELLFSVQFHTCAITNKEVTFTKNELDFACDDPRFPKDNRITLHLSSLATNDNNYVFQSPLIRTEPPNTIAKADSVENFDMSSSYHTQGPLDGSLYATILKSPKSHPNHLTLNRSQSVQESFSQQNVISPPPQFSNKQYDVIERRPVSSSTPIRSNSVENSTLRRETSVTTTTTTSSDTLRGPSQSRSDYSYVESRPGTSQSTYQEKYNTLDAATKTGNYPSGTQQQQQQQQQQHHHHQIHHHHHHQHQHHQQSHQTTPITIVETYATIDGGNAQSYQNGRQSVRSPLTLSMDSGISSSGVLNRPPQGSSVSPSSFPSQASPQEDRHRELDDILSDMLMTVQDIPDFNKSYKQHTTVQKIVRSQSVIPTTSGSYGLPSTASVTSHHHNHNQQQQQQQYSQDTVKRSQSYSATPQSNLVPLSATQSTSSATTINSSYLVKDRGVDFYDTSSTTTTLTPPPSESGRDTPIIAGGSTGVGGGSSSNISTLQRRHTLQREKRELQHTAPAATIGDQQHQQQGMIMNLQQHQHHHNHQSSVYPQTIHTTTTDVITVSEDDDNIPYHAREDSQPFTYGNVPPVIPNGQIHTDQQDPRMIKTQSGLSSPSLVRKTLGSSQTLRKTPSRNDFEEMLRERREKVMSEKYSISDKPSSVDFDKNFDRPWANSGATLRQTNGYHYYNEPLKRSNTLEGFHRSTSTDGISGQTWLQLQQQKLRAKKDQQMREDRRYFEEQIHTEIRNRPLRSRANVQRYDGYASDTAAFADEVDYRRPLHVQTPYRSPDRYHTITTTTKTIVSQPERPFATVKRAHDITKRDAYGVREESFSSYRSETDPELSIAGSPRPETPAFPVTPRTPYGLSSNGSVSPALPPKSPTSQRKDLYTGTQKGQLHEVVNQNETISCYASRRNSNSSNANSEPQEVAPHHVKFVQDSSKYWYKPNLSREEAVNLLRNAVPGTFIVRDSTTFRNAFGLVVRVAHPPPGVVSKGNQDELVRHFLVEPTSRGVRLKGCANEPVFTSLSALVYQHSITPLALPCRLIIPDRDIQTSNYQSPAQKQLLTQGAACNVLYLYVCDTESLTGEEAVRRAVHKLFSTIPLPKPTEVHFKVSQQGITLTDNTRQKFFRKHYSANIVSFCGFDPDRHMWTVKATEGETPVDKKTIFAFVARRSASSTDNQCHVFCDLQPNQPATAIVSFVNKVLPTERVANQHI